MMKQLTINVEGWPDRVVKMVERFVEALAHQFRDKPPSNNGASLPLWPGVSLPPEKLRRVEIYKDAC